ncbi:MAG: HAMP domain-containing histidine kinase, partial [Bacteroidia bacterium]|nr:HAMP domain-containing histidine kinase [Bacteroidia bacterium]
FEELKYLDGYSEIDKAIHLEGAAILYSNAHRLSAIVSNLISNSIKYRDKRKGRCVIQLSASVTPGEVTIHFYDNGIGIHPDYLPNVFDMFFRGTSYSDGAGLGLYIVKEMVEKMSGRIVINSILDKETMITITLPNKLPAAN